MASANQTVKSCYNYYMGGCNAYLTHEGPERQLSFLARHYVTKR